MKHKDSTSPDLLKAVHETAVDLYATGLISERRMKLYEALCLEEVPIVFSPHHEEE